MNKNQLIEAGIALDITTQSAPRGLSAGRPRQRPADSPALLLEKRAEEPSHDRAMGSRHTSPIQRGFNLPARSDVSPQQFGKTTWQFMPSRKPSKLPPLPDPLKLPADYLARRPTSSELHIEQGFHAPGGKQIKHKGVVAPVVTGVRGLLGGAGGAIGNILGYGAQLGGGVTDAVGVTNNAWDAIKKGRVPYQNASQRGWHQFTHNRTSSALDDWLDDEITDNSKLTQLGLGAFDAASEIAPFAGRLPIGKGGTYAAMPLIAADVAAIPLDSTGGRAPLQQVFDRLSTEEIAALDESFAADVERRVRAGTDPQVAVEQAKRETEQRLMHGQPPKEVPAQEKTMSPYDPANPQLEAGAEAAQALPQPIPEPVQAPPNPQLAAGAEAAQALPQPQAPASPQLQAGAAAAQAMPAGPQAGPQAPQPAPAAPAPPAGPAAPPAGPAAPAAPAGQEAPPQAPSPAAQLVWEGPVGDDAYQRALQNPMDMEQVGALTDAVNGGQIPQEQVPRAVQQIIAYDSIDKAMQEANKTGEPIEQALGRIAQQRAGGEFDADDLTKAFPRLERQAAEEDVAKRQAAGDPAADVEQQMQENRQDPSLIDRLGMMWSGMDTGEKIGLVVGVIGSVVALANGLMGGSGMTTIMAGALGLGGLGYAFGGGDMIKKWFGGDAQAAGPKAPEESKGTPVPTGEGVAVGGDEPAVGPGIGGPPSQTPFEPGQNPRGPGFEAAMPPGPADAPEQQAAADNDVLQGMLADGQVTQQELEANADVLRGMEASRLVPLIQAAPPELQNRLKFLSEMAPQRQAATVEWAAQQTGGKLTPEDFYKMLEAYKLSMPQGQQAA